MILHLKTKTLSWPNSMLQLSPHFAVPLYIGALKNKMLSMLHLPLSSPSWTQSGLSAHHSTKMTFVEITILLEKYHTAVDHSLLLFALCHHILLTCLSLHWPLLLISFTGSSSSAQMLGGSHSPVALYFIQRISQSLFSSLQVSAWWITHPSDSVALSPVLPSAFHSPPATLAPWTKTHHLRFYPAAFALAVSSDGDTSPLESFMAGSLICSEANFPPKSSLTTLNNIAILPLRPPQSLSLTLYVCLLPYVIQCVYSFFIFLCLLQKCKLCDFMPLTLVSPGPRTVPST